MRPAAAALALALVAALGCSGGRSSPAPGSGSGTGSASNPVRPERRPSEARPESKGPPTDATPSPDAASSPDAGSLRPAAFAPLDPVRIPDTTTQLVVATTRDWREVDATVWFFERKDARAPWKLVEKPWPAVIGREGMAWGRGAHGDGPPPGRGGPRKVEGDGKSPAGLFAIGPAYGYAAKPPRGTKLPYTTATDTWRCVDDPASRHYNLLLDETTVTPDWSSREDLRRDDDAYRWVVELRHNPDGHPGSGSCIFLHVWGGPGSRTVGCTAMDERILARLLARLDPARSPMFVLLTSVEYNALAKPWALPTLP